MITPSKRLIAALAVILPAASLITAPVMAAAHAKKPHHVSVHKASTHRTSHSRKTTAPTAS